MSVSVHHDTGDDEDDYDSNDSDDDGNVDNVNDGSGVSVTWEEGDDHSSDEDGIIFLSPGDNNRHHRIQKVHRSSIRPKLGLGVVSKDDAWFLAKQAELASIKEHQVWDVVDYSPGMKPITCK